MLKKGTRLGNIEPADVVGPASLEPTLPATPMAVKTISSEQTTVQSAKKSKETPTEEVLEDIMNSLPTALTEFSFCRSAD